MMVWQSVRIYVPASGMVRKLARSHLADCEVWELATWELAHWVWMRVHAHLPKISQGGRDGAKGIVVWPFPIGVLSRMLFLSLYLCLLGAHTSSGKIKTRRERKCEILALKTPTWVLLFKYYSLSLEMDICVCSLA